MDTGIKTAEKIAQEYVNEVKKHIKVNRVMLYGSYANGTFDKESDLDIAIFSENFKDRKFVEVTAFLLSLARKYRKICIEPVGFSNLDLVGDNPFIKEIVSTGKEFN